jgi:hypothetical protein
MIREYLRNPYAPSSLRAYLRGGWWMFKAFGVCAASTVEALMRRNVGERYLPLMCAGCAVLWFMTALVPIKPLLPYYAAAVSIMTVRHVASAALGRDMAARHSHSPGDVLPIWTELRVPSAFVRRVIEPGLCLFASTFASVIDPGLSAWLIVAGATLFVKEIRSALRQRRRVVDAYDSRVEAQEFSNALNGACAMERGTRHVRMSLGQPAAVRQFKDERSDYGDDQNPSENDHCGERAGAACLYFARDGSAPRHLGKERPSAHLPGSAQAVSRITPSPDSTAGDRAFPQRHRGVTENRIAKTNMAEMSL